MGLNVLQQHPYLKQSATCKSFAHSWTAYKGSHHRGGKGSTWENLETKSIFNMMGNHAIYQNPAAMLYKIKKVPKTEGQRKRKRRKKISFWPKLHLLHAGWSRLQPPLSHMLRCGSCSQHALTCSTHQIWALAYQIKMKHCLLGPVVCEGRTSLKKTDSHRAHHKTRRIACGPPTVSLQHHTMPEKRDQIWNLGCQGYKD